MIAIDDRMAILDLCAEYNYYIDTGQSEKWAETFTADGVFEGTVGKAAGRDALIAFSEKFGSDYPGALHFTDNHLFALEGDVVKHRCFLSFQVPSETGVNLVLAGYEDELVRVDGAWRFRSRRVGPLKQGS